MHSIQRGLKGVEGVSSKGSTGTTSSVASALVIIIESAAVYLVTVTAFLILYLSRSNAQYAVLAMVIINLYHDYLPLINRVE
jgi:hypothetical protein